MRSAIDGFFGAFPERIRAGISLAVGARVAVDPHFIAVFATQKLVHRQAKGFTGQVPQCGFNG